MSDLTGFLMKESFRKSLANWFIRTDIPNTARFFRNLERPLNAANETAAQHSVDSVILVAGGPGCAECVDRLSDMAVTLHFQPTIPEAERFLDLEKPCVSYLLVCIDGLQSLGQTVEQLLDFRKAYPDIPVILLSAEFSRDDYGTERLSIADSSVRIPVSIPRMEMALVQAEYNTSLRQWQDEQSCLSVNRIGKGP